MSSQIRIKPAPKHPDTEVKIILPSGHYVYISNDLLLPLADTIADWVEYGEAKNNAAE